MLQKIGFSCVPLPGLLLLVLSGLFSSQIVRADLEADWIASQAAVQPELDAFYANAAAGKVDAKDFSTEFKVIRPLIGRAFMAGVRIESSDEVTGPYFFWQIVDGYLEGQIGSEVSAERRVAALRAGEYGLRLTNGNADKHLFNQFGDDYHRKDLFIKPLTGVLKEEKKLKGDVLYGPEAAFLLGRLYLYSSFEIGTDFKRDPEEAAKYLQQCVDYMMLPDLADARGNRVHPSVYRHIVYCAGTLSRMYREGVGVERNADKANQLIRDTQRIMGARLAGLPWRNAPEAGRHGFIDLPPELEALFL